MLATSQAAAWSRPLTWLTSGGRPLRAAGTLPRPSDPVGTPGAPSEINTVVVLMLENHSFDNILGLLPYQVHSRRMVDGLPGNGQVPLSSNPDSNGNPVVSFHLPDLCPSQGLTQNWNSSHNQYDGGLNDGFVTNANSTTPMGYFDISDLPVTYALATHFPINERYFCSVLGQTDPNRLYLFCATSNGQTNDTIAPLIAPIPSGSIFDQLDAAQVPWTVYFANAPSPELVANFRNNPAQVAKCVSNAQFFTDAAAGQLPAVTFVEPNFSVQSEENPQDVAFGENFLLQVVTALFESPQWGSTAMFLTYDEHGGYFDHVPPPPAIPPDDVAPLLGQPGEGTAPGGFDRYGFRVPFTLISPWARPRYASQFVSDHTSILSFIEHKWNLPAMTRRDANAWPLFDMFDMHQPHFLTPPALPAGPSIAATVAQCIADGHNPPTLS